MVESKTNLTIDARAALARAKQIVKDMTASKESEVSNSGRFYTEELDINDYPPLARKNSRTPIEPSVICDAIVPKLITGAMQEK
jgi:hypothetical protein